MARLLNGGALIALLLACCAGVPAAALSAAAEAARRSKSRCKMPALSQAANVAQHAYMQRQSDPGAKTDSNGRVARASYTIKVYFHIFRAGSTKAKGDVSNGFLSAQVKQLNRFYNEHGFTFKLAGTTRTTDFKLFAQMLGYGGHREYPAKKRTHKGSWDSLNIWVLGSLFNPETDTPGEYTLGFARFPYDPESLGAYINQYTPVLALDGITIRHSEMFRNSSGKLTTTIPHETGHWLGLFHTFEGKCQTPGDGVADTPYEALPGYGCKPRNTCTTRPGLDPIHNIMDYSSDDCQRGFTKGQGERMRKIWNLFRNPATRRAKRSVSEAQVYKYVLGNGASKRK